MHQPKQNHIMKNGITKPTVVCRKAFASVAFRWKDLYESILKQQYLQLQTLDH